MKKRINIIKDDSEYADELKILLEYKKLLDEKKKFASWTYRDVIRLGSFPDDYHAKTDKIGKYMIGMSVPPKMTEQVARAVIDQWLQSKQNKISKVIKS